MIREDPAVLAYVRRAVPSRPGSDGRSWPTVDDVMAVTARSWPVHGRLDVDDRVLPTPEEARLSALRSRRAQARAQYWAAHAPPPYTPPPVEAPPPERMVVQPPPPMADPVSHERFWASYHAVIAEMSADAIQRRLQEEAITLSWERGAERPADYQPPSRTWADIDAEEQEAIRQQRLQEGR